MLNFAEQTGSGAVIVVWSFLFVPTKYPIYLTHSHPNDVIRIQMTQLTSKWRFQNKVLTPNYRHTSTVHLQQTYVTSIFYPPHLPRPRDLVFLQNYYLINTHPHPYRTLLLPTCTHIVYNPLRTAEPDVHSTYLWGYKYFALDFISKFFSVDFSIARVIF